jgi:hypothetical protein
MVFFCCGIPFIVALFPLVQDVSSLVLGVAFHVVGYPFHGGVLQLSLNALQEVLLRLRWILMITCIPSQAILTVVVGM